jgi:hypothetical protein
VTADHAHLHGGGERSIGVQMRADRACADQPLDRAAGVVVAEHGQQPGLRADIGDVARHVGRAAEALVGPVHLDHRHRRLGRDALDLAEPVAVEHRVADDEHAAAGEVVFGRRLIGLLHFGEG